MTPGELADDLSIDVRELRKWLREHHPRSSAGRGTPWRITSAMEHNARVAFGQPPSLKTDLRNLARDVRGELSELKSELAETARQATSDIRSSVADARTDLQNETAD